MFIEKVFVFILFLGPLVFFHELGHFLFARLFKVRVEVFSVGFGPKLLKRKFGETEYAVSLIPLGGYVKMFGDDQFKKDEVPVSEREYSFSHQSKWARFWIVFGGPLANFIMTFIIFFLLLMNGENIPEIKIPYLAKNHPLYSAGLRTGDIISEINGKVVYNPSDLMGEGDAPINKIKIKRWNENLTLETNIKPNLFFDELIKLSPIFRKPILVNKNGEKFYLANKNQINLDNSISLEEISMNPLNDKKLWLFSFENLKQVGEISIDYNDLTTLLTQLKAQGYTSYDMMIKSINMNSPADKAHLQANDILISLNNNGVNSFEDFREKLQLINEKVVTVSLWRKGEILDIQIQPEVSKIDGKDLKLLGVISSIEVVMPKYLKTPSRGFFTSIHLGAKRTWDSMRKTLDGFVKLFSAQAPLKSISGPISIGKIAHDSFKTSLSYFFQLMALISVNLGIINLFPIPVLDGGHIMFIGLEILNGGPLSRRKMEIAQQAGLSILLMLMVGALFNDFSRFF